MTDLLLLFFKKELFHASIANVQWDSSCVKKWAVPLYFFSFCSSFWWKNLNDVHFSGQFSGYENHHASPFHYKHFQTSVSLFLLWLLHISFGDFPDIFSLIRKTSHQSPKGHKSMTQSCDHAAFLQPVRWCYSISGEMGDGTWPALSLGIPLAYCWNLLKL